MPFPFESGRKILIMPKRIPEETKQRAMRLVLDHLDDYPNLTTACDTVAGKLGTGG
jgi:transposase